MTHFTTEAPRTTVGPAATGSGERELTPRIVRIATEQDPRAIDTSHARNAPPAALVPGVLSGRGPDGAPRILEAVVRVCGGPTGRAQFRVEVGTGVPMVIPAEPAVESWLLKQPVTWD